METRPTSDPSEARHTVAVPWRGPFAFSLRRFDGTGKAVKSGEAEVTRTER